MKRRFEVLLVDEFQDTNDVQLDLVAMLGESRDEERTVEPGESLSERIVLAPDRLFLVGDPSSRSTPFGGADVAVWNKVRHRLVEELQVVEETALQQNHRSGPGLLAFGNHWFPDVLGRKDIGDPLYVVRFEPDDALEPARAEAHRAPPVEFLAVSEKAGPEVEARAVARWIQRYTRGDGDYAVYNGTNKRRFADIAILLRQFRHLSVFQDALQRLRIPHYVVKGRGFYGCPEIRDLHLALRLLLDPDDGLALVGVLRSPLFLVSDAGLIWLQRGARGRSRTPLTFEAVQEALTRLEGSMTDEDKAAVQSFVAIWRRLLSEADRLGPRDVLDALIQLTHYREKLAGTFRGRQKIGNIEKLLSIAEHYERTTHGQLSGFATRLHELIETEPREPEGQVVEETADAVRIMTIHQSKGLEFPVVMIPQIHTMADRRLGGSPVQYDRDHGLQVRLRVRHMGHVIADVETEGYDDLRKTIKAREDAEEKRLVYVAVTRARDLLWLSGRGMAVLEDGGRSAIRQDNPLTALQTRVDLEDPALTGLVRERFIKELMASIPEDEAALAEEARAEADPSWPEAIERAVAQTWRQTQGPASTTLAAAQLADFHRCPQRYLLWYVMGLRDGEEGEDGREWSRDGSEGPQAILDRGTAAHAALERLDFEAYAKADAFERRWLIDRALRAREIWLPNEERAEVTEALVGFLDGSGWIGELAAAQAQETLWREVPFVLHAEHGGDEVFIKGRIDMMLGGEDGAFAVIDHKYSARPEAGIAPHLFQLKTYALAARTLFGQDGSGWQAGAVFLRDPGAKPEMTGGEGDALDNFRESLPALARRLLRSRRTGVWPRQAPDGQTRTAGRCRAEGCGFRARCFGTKPGGGRS